MSNEMRIQADANNMPFIMVYEDVWQALLNDPHALAVYMALVRRTHSGNRAWYSKKKIMAQESGVSQTTFEDRIKKLVELGLVLVTPQYRKPETGEIRTSKGDGFVEQIQNIYTVRDRVPPTRETGDPHPRDGRSSHVGRATPTRETGPNIDPLHKPQTHIPKSEGASAPAAAAAPPTPRKKLAHELPENWRPDPHVWEQMAKQRPDVDLELEHAKFCDYWPSQPGSRSRKKDWNATWRNWIRNARPSQGSGGKVENTLEAWGFVSEGSNLPWEDPAPTFDDTPFIDHQEVF